jgi:hypothetical protein
MQVVRNNDQPRSSRRAQEAKVKVTRQAKLVRHSDDSPWAER